MSDSLSRSPPGEAPALTEMTSSAALSRPEDLAAPDPAQPGPMAVLARLNRIAVPVILAIVLLKAMAVWYWPAVPGLAAGAASVSLALAMLAAWVAERWRGPQARTLVRSLRRQLAADPDTLVFTGTDGAVIGADGPGADPGIEAWLQGWCAEPRRTVAQALEDLRRTGGVLREFRRGAAALRLSAHRVGGSEVVLWRLSRIERPGRRGLDAFGVPVLTLGPDGAPVAANPALLRLVDLHETGRDRAGAGPALAEAVAPILSQIGPGPHLGPVRLRLPGGQPAEAHPVAGRDGQLDLMILPEGAVRLAGTDGLPDYEDIPVALLRIDPEGCIQGSNRAARSLLGLQPAEDRPLWEVVEGLGRPVADWLHDARTGRALNRPEVLRAACAGVETFVQIILRRAPAPAPPGTLLAVISDATELKSLEARFVQSQKMQAIGQLAGGIAHDFNNLLTAISGHCDLLLMGRDAFDPDHDDLQQIRQNANRAAALVRQLLAFSRKQTLQPEVFQIETMLEDVVRLLARLVGERITLRLRHDPGLHPIRADRRQLEQVIVNLVVNARDAMPMGGTIRIETESVSLATDRTIGRARLPAGLYSVIRIIDNGVGIPAEIRDKVFEPFFTTKRPGEGTGLGLSTAYGIVKQMGGFIFFESREGSGTEFMLYFAADPASGPEAPAGVAAGGGEAVPDAAAGAPALPALGREATGPRAAGSAPGRTGRRMGPGAAEPALGDPGATVLLVEDEAPVRAFAARALRLHGYRVLEAADGETALEILTERQETVDIVLTDVIMPGLDGPTWVAQALETRPGLPVVFVSGYIEDTLTEALGRTPNAVFLEKPFTLEALNRTLSAQLEAAGRTGARAEARG